MYRLYVVEKIWREVSCLYELSNEPNRLENERHIQSRLLEVKGVERFLNSGNQRLHVLKGIDMELYNQQLVMLGGRSSSGKTTLLNLIGGLDLPSRGEIFFQGQPFHLWNDQQRTMARRTEIGFVF